MARDSEGEAWVVKAKEALARPTDEQTLEAWREVLKTKPNPEDFGGSRPEPPAYDFGGDSAAFFEFVHALWEWEESPEVQALFRHAADVYSAPLRTAFAETRSLILLQALEAWAQYEAYTDGLEGSANLCPECGAWPHRDTCHSRWRPGRPVPARRKTGGKAATKGEAIAHMREVGKANCSNATKYQNARDPSRHLSDRAIRNLFGGWPAARNAAFRS